ncbi:MAG: hypothetical protein FD152_1712 [Xanthobacteraceae bacterium]|nr:MAG: hypothetical protein FD152_1712 [Xanthobacteraceae bacterium]
MGERRNAEQDGRRDGRAEIAGESVEREGTPHALAVHAGGEQRVVGRVIDAIGEARSSHGHQQDGIGRLQREEDEADAADDKPGHQNPSRPEPVAGEPHRGLHQQRHQIEQGEGKTDLQEAPPEMTRQERQERRQCHDVDMADEMRR